MSDRSAAPIHPFLAELEWRGLLQDQSEGLPDRLARGALSGYVGFDPTAPSLHVGNLIPISDLVHLQRTGAGAPVGLVGGGTGMIGDPSGKSAERNLLDEQTLDFNRAAIREQLERFLDFSGSFAARVLDNREWLGRYGLLDWLREIGKHFSVSYMLSKDSVQNRLAGGISFTEFSYMTLQGTDFLHLHRDHGVELQMGGADQWGNITAGLELIRRIVGRGDGETPAAFALSSPLLLTSGGTKFGKTEAGTVWLAPTMTSPYAFYQYWIEQDDRDVGMMLRRLTLLGADEIYGLEEEQQRAPEARPAQRRLAWEMTARVHGADEARRQVQVAEAVFSGEPLRDAEVLDVLFDELDGFEFGEEELRADAVGLAVASRLYPSRSEARRQIGQGGFSINDERVGAVDAPVPEPIAGRYLVLRAGRKRLVIGRRRRD
ncbi:MAG TPA: tyrosine--tRNA ligase [Candidatus Caenarcaniphilales bacterium]|nr:tyrosine--tRNA ligase [Candidatus Caenarcaniphilales bacterium]